MGLVYNTDNSLITISDTRVLLNSSISASVGGIVDKISKNMDNDREDAPQSVEDAIQVISDYYHPLLKTRCEGEGATFDA